MTLSTTVIHVRVHEHIKTQATQTLAAMGLTVSDVVRVFLTRVVADQQLPFELKSPNAATNPTNLSRRSSSRDRRQDTTPSRKCQAGMA